MKPDYLKSPEAFAKAWDRYTELGGPALKENVRVSPYLLKDPLAQPERYAEIVRPLWDSAVDLVEKDYLAALRVADRLQTIHLPHLEKHGTRRRASYELLSGVRDLVKAEEMIHGGEATLFQGFGLRLVTDFPKPGGWWHDDRGRFVYMWKVDLKDSIPAAGGSITIEAKDITYGLLAKVSPEEGRLSLFSMKGTETFSEVRERLNKKIASHSAEDEAYEERAQQRLDRVELRLRIMNIVIKRFETGGELERYSRAVEEGMGHAERLARSRDYCGRYALRLMDEEGLDKLEAFDKIKDEVGAEFPEMSPAFPEADKLYERVKYQRRKNRSEARRGRRKG